MDFLAKLTGKRDGGHVPPQITQLEELLANAQEERERIVVLLSSFQGDDVTAVPRVLERLEQRAAGLNQLVDDASGRAERLLTSSGVADVLEARIAALEACVERAVARADAAMQRAAQVGDQFEALNGLVALAQGTVERLDAFVRDVPLMRSLEQVPAVREECEQLNEAQARLSAHFDELHGASLAVAQRAEAAADLASRVDAQTGLTAERMDAVERRLEQVSQLQVLTFDTTGELQNLNALAEHVNVKVRTLENQQQTIERALVDSRRVSEMLWEMDAHIQKLRDGAAMADSVDQTLTRLEKLHDDVASRLDAATRDRIQFSEAVDHAQQKGRELLHTVQGQLDRLAVTRTEIGTLTQRIGAAETGLANTDRQLAALAASEAALSGLQNKLDAFASRADAIASDIARIEQKQPFLHALDTRLDELDGEIRRTTLRVEGLHQRRQELDALKAEFDACQATYVQVRARAKELCEQKQQFSVFADHVRGLMRGTPELEASIHRLTESVGETTKLAERAIAMRPQIEELGGRLDLLTPRFPAMEQLQARLSALNALSGDIDHKLAAQVDRQADLDQARILCEGLAVQITDAQQKLATLEAAQARLSSVPEQLTEVQVMLAEARRSATAIQQEQNAVVAHKLRLAEIHESAAALFGDIGERLEALQSVHAELGRADALKDELCRQINHIQSIEREAFEQHQQAESLVEQCTLRWKQVDQRRADLATVEQAMAAAATRFQTLDRLTETLDDKISWLADRHRIVDAVKQEIEAVHELARRCQEDLGVIADERVTISETRAGVDRLAGALAEADEKLADVERRSAAVENVRRKADTVVRLLEDVHVALDTVSEQKAVLDHVTESLAQFEDAITEARGTTRALQAERKLAQRIVENVRHIHARAGAEA